jgi:hypothetical protein
MEKLTTHLLIVCLLLTSLGCGSAERATKHAISGTVTYGGDPVPSGSLRLTPDHDKGNRGPATTIVISEGTYQSLPDYGVVGGPYIAEITGFEALSAEEAEKFVTPKPLFKPFTVAVDLEAGANVKNFDVPQK